MQGAETLCRKQSGECIDGFLIGVNDQAQRRGSVSCYHQG